ncbi:MAG: hypothetical protein Q4D81_15310 [Eubacteriales bacterium]|nr:hypothetical protein [Eubacteriales bacterium]
MNNMFNGMFMKVQKGMCMLSPFGIAVKTSAGYRSYNVKTGKLRNCDNMVFSFGEGMFFVIPASRVKPGDIILSGGKPACVRRAGKDSIEVINYENATVETLLPERHIFMGNTWFYGKIVSLFGDGASICGKKNIAKMMKFMMMSSLFEGGGCAAAAGGGSTGMTPFSGANTAAPSGGMNTNMLMPLLLMKSGGFDDLFGNLFEGDDPEEVDDDGGDKDMEEDTLF